MTDKELKKLRRRELLELLVRQTEDNERLQAEIESLKKELQDKNLKISEAGSLADALLSINDMFSSADEIAKQYMDNVRKMAERQKGICNEMEQMCKKRCRAMIAATERECEARKKELEMFGREGIPKNDKYSDAHSDEEHPEQTVQRGNEF